MWKTWKTVSKGDYTYAVVPDHPKATKNGYVLEHRIVMENYLGRLLEEDELVHHIDEDRKNNPIENLELVLKGYHEKLHGLKKGRIFVILKCPNCEKMFEIPKRQSYLRKSSEYTCCSRKCRGQFSRRIQLYGKTAVEIKAIEENLVKEFRKHRQLNTSVAQLEEPDSSKVAVVGSNPSRRTK